MRRLLYLVPLALIASSVFLAGCGKDKDTAGEAERAYKGPGPGKAGSPGTNPSGSGPTSK